MNKLNQTIETSFKYEIYPIPHHIAYTGTTISLDNEIHIFYDQTIDEITKKRVSKAFIDNDYSEPITTENLSNNGINIFIGTKDSRDVIEKYVKDDFSKIKINFTEIDSYYLSIKDNTIIILGKDTNAAFYGVVTLESILKQSKKDKILYQLTINDYANTEIRGFIEGFYGIPWSNEERMELMNFGGNFKITNYIFAPKDDPYHRKKWYQLYPKDMLAGIHEMVKVGNNNKIRFVWTVSPLLDVASIAQKSGDEAAMALLESNIEKLIRKFNQLYEVGVRQFGILGDDVGVLPLDYVVQLMNAVSQWAEKKGDVYNTIYTPAAYNEAWAWDGGRELNFIEEGFAENIHIHWTGENTVAPITQSTIDFFKNKDTKEIIRRDPLFWLNWPVNDIDYSLVLLGKGEMLKPRVTNLAGVVTNPMQEAEASKISIFAVADYSWNTEKFDNQKSWEDSIKYIEPYMTEELLELASHMTYANPEVGFGAEESESIKKLLNVTSSRLNEEKSLSQEVETEKLRIELQEIAKHAEKYLRSAQNKKLKVELAPFVKALKDLVLVAVNYIEIIILLEEENHDEAIEKYKKAESLYFKSLNYDRLMLDGEKKAKPAQRRLQPFVKQLNKIISSKIENIQSFNRKGIIN